MSSNYPFDPKKKEQNEPFGEIMKHMNHFFQEKPVRGLLQSIDEFFKTPFPLAAFPVNLTENEKEHIIIAELPGVKKDQISINVLGNSLTIGVNNQEEIIEDDEKNKHFRKKQSISRASRTISLPFSINEQMVKASYKNGLLEIHVPKQNGKQIIIDHD